jgi:hypothetical protein
LLLEAELCDYCQPMSVCGSTYTDTQFMLIYFKEKKQGLSLNHSLGHSKILIRSCSPHTKTRKTSQHSIYLRFYSPCGPWLLFQFLNLYIVSRTPWTGDQPVTRPLPTHRTQIQNKSTQTSMPRVGFEPTIPVFKREKTVHV